MSNVTLLQLRDRANAAAKQQADGDKSHGTAGILAVATLVEGIHAKLFNKIVGTTAFPFTDRHACDVARIYFNRYNELCMTEGTDQYKYYKGKGELVGEKEAADWRRIICTLLFPYTINKIEQEPKKTRGQILKLYDGATAAVKASVIAQLDDTDYKREMISKSFNAACLYVARDMDQSYWLASNVDPKDRSKPFGMWIASYDLCPLNAKPVWDDNDPILIKPVRDSKVQFGYKTKNANGGIDDSVVTANFANLMKAWRIVAQSDDTKWKVCFETIAAQVTKDWDIPANARDAFDKAYNAMLTYKTEVLTPATARDTPKPETKEETAHDIANRDNVTLKVG